MGEGPIAPVRLVDDAIYIRNILIVPVPVGCIP